MIHVPPHERHATPDLAHQSPASTGSQRFSLHLITDRGRVRRLPTDASGFSSVIHAASLALAHGADWVQVREKGGSARDVLHITRSLLPVAADQPIPRGVLVNDRVDVVLASGAHGVHLAKKSLPPRLVRRLLGPRLLMGVSVHSLEEALEAVEAGADYLTFGHIFPTESKPGLPPRGLEALQRVVEAVPVPVLAIGGITAQRLPSVLETGCAGVALIGGVMAAEDPVEAVRALRRVMDASPARPRHPFPPPPPVPREPAGNAPAGRSPGGGA